MVKEATYKEAGERYRTCTKCNLKQTEYPTKLECTEHNWSDWEVVTPATCQATGLQRKECTKCGTIQEEEIPLAAHGYANGKCPTCGAASELVLGATIDYKEYIDTNTNSAFTSMPFYKSTSDKNGYTDTTYTVANNSGIEWIVLGEENGQIKITTKNIVQPSEGGYTSSRGYKLLYLTGKNAYMYFTDELHEIGAIYGKGKYADTSKFTVTTGGNTGGRSFIMEDLGYNSLTRTAKYIYAKHSDGYIYRYPTTATAEDIANETSTTGGTGGVFEYLNIDGSNTTSEANKEWKSLENTGDSVTIYDYTYGGSITLNTNISKVGTSYWLASRDENCDTNALYLGTHDVSSSGRDGNNHLRMSYWQNLRRR